jgi:hypothetical protein
MSAQERPAASPGAPRRAARERSASAPGAAALNNAAAAAAAPPPAARAGGGGGGGGGDGGGVSLAEVLAQTPARCDGAKIRCARAPDRAAPGRCWTGRPTRRTAPCPHARRPPSARPGCRSPCTTSAPLTAPRRRPAPPARSAVGCGIARLGPLPRRARAARAAYLSGNDLAGLEGAGQLPGLRALSLANNLVGQSDDLAPLRECPALEVCRGRGRRGRRRPRPAGGGR